MTRPLPSHGVPALWSRDMAADMARVQREEAASRMVAALYVQTGGCYYGLPGCYFTVLEPCSAYAPQRPRGCKSLSRRLSRREPREGEEANCGMAGSQSGQERRELATLARGEPRESQGEGTSLPEGEPREDTRSATRLAREDWLQSVGEAPGLQQGPAASRPRAYASGLRRDAREAGRRLRYLRRFGAGHKDSAASLRGPLPRDRSHPWSSLWPLQFNVGPCAGQGRPSSTGGGLS